MTRPHPLLAPSPGRSRAAQRNGPFRFVSMHRVPVGFGQLFDGPADVRARVVDQDVDAAEVAFDVRGQTFDIGRRS